jgi:DNA-binding response OmpR family regulator
MPKRTIVVIDDCEVIRKQLKFMFREDHVVCFFNGESCLNYIAQNKIDLVITDINLPGISGNDILRSIRETKKVPVIAISGNDYGKGGGFTGFLKKPFNKSKFEQVYRLA